MEPSKLKESKKLFENFVNRFLASLSSGTQAPVVYHLPDDDPSAAEEIADVLSTLSEFFYSRVGNVEGATQDGEAMFSEYHRFWMENCVSVLGISINKERCQALAERFELYYK